MSTTFQYSKCTRGVFDQYTNAFIYNKYRDEDTTLITSNDIRFAGEGSGISDFIGFVDRDVEQLIGEERENV